MAWHSILTIVWRACAKNNSDPLPLQDHPLSSCSTSLSFCSVRVVCYHCFALICILFLFRVIVLSHGYTKANKQFWTRSSLWCDQCSEHHSARVVLGRFAFVRAPYFAEHLQMLYRTRRFKYVLSSVTAHIRQILQALANTNKRSVCWCLHWCNCTFSCYCQIDNFLVLKKLFGFPVISDLRRSDLRGFPLPIKKVVFVFNSFVLKLNKKCAIPCFKLIV